MGYCIQPNQCRVRFAPSLLLFFTAVALLLSLLSSLECQFLTLIIPTAVEGEEELGPKTIDIGLGLWTFEMPPILEGLDEYTNAPGKRMCVSYSTARSVGGLTTASGFLPYYEPFGNADRPWTLSRVFAVLGMIGGAVACVVLGMIMAKHKRRRKQSKVLIAQATTCAFLSESIKFGLFFNNYYCMSTTAWVSGEEAEEGGSAECDLDRGSAASLIALLAYLGVSVTVLLHLSRPPNARHKVEYSRDDFSVPSFLHSVGISVGNSRQSDATSRNAGGSSCGIAASKNFNDRREYFRMQKHRPQLQTVTESSRAPSLPAARPPPKKITLTTDQSVYTNALSSVGMGTAGLDGHSCLSPHPRSHSTQHEMHSSVTAASTAPSRIQFVEEEYHHNRRLGSARDPKGLHRNIGASAQSKRTSYNNERIHGQETSDTPPWLPESQARNNRSSKTYSSSRRLHYAPSRSRMIDRGNLSFQDLEEQAPRRDRSYRSLGAGTSVGMGTVGHQGPAGSGVHHLGARGA